MKIAASVTGLSIIGTNSAGEQIFNYTEEKTSVNIDLLGVINAFHELKAAANSPAILDVVVALFGAGLQGESRVENTPEAYDAAVAEATAAGVELNLGEAAAA